MKTVIFLGPSLPVDEARQVLPDAIYLPPVAQADLLSAVTRYRPDVIGVIDGVFSQSLSVWHKEILYALEQGITVYGASSMGALRAVETAPFGMIGVGEVYRMYASGEITDDDEVAVVHGPAEAGYKVLSEAMVNIRYTVAAARRAGIIDDAAHDQLIKIAKDTFYPDRSYPHLLQAARDAGIDGAVVDRLADYIATSAIDIKRQDAITLLETIRDLPEDARPVPANFTLTRSHLFEALYNRDRTVYHGDVDVPLANISAYAALHLPDFPEINAAALNRELVGILAELLAVEVTDEEIDAEEQRLRFNRRVEDEAAFERWLERNDLSRGEFRSLMRSQAICRKLRRWLITRKYLERTTKTVLDELRLRGRYEAVAEDAALQEQILRTHFPNFEEAGYSDLSLQDLIEDQLRSAPWRPDTDIPQWAEESGFKDLYDLRYELLRARLARGFLADVTAQLKEALAGTPGSNGAATADHAGSN